MTFRKREKRAKDRIYEALIRLISSSDKPYEDLTIQDIVDEAEVCRNSFYRSFQSKNDIFQEKFMEIANESGKLIHSFDGSPITKIFYSFFETARRNRQFLLCFYEAMPKVYFDTFTGIIIHSNLGSRDLKDVPSEDYYRYACRAWITVGILTEWMKRGCDESTDWMVAHFEKMCAGLLP